jgi:dihydrofolate reductase
MSDTLSTSPAHTEAPWTIEYDGYERTIVAKRDATDVLLGSRTIVATCHQDDEADALLIAAAPDLLAACKALVSVEPGGDIERVIENEIVPAIKKAELISLSA